VFFLGRNSYIYYRLFNNLSLSAEDYVKKFAKFKNFKIKEGYYKLVTYVYIYKVLGWGNCSWGSCKWGSYIVKWGSCSWGSCKWGG